MASPVVPIPGTTTPMDPVSAVLPKIEEGAEAARPDLGEVLSIMFGGRERGMDNICCPQQYDVDVLHTVSAIANIEC